MKADSITIQDFFNTERRHVLPLCQRPYVWPREGQWEPLWEDRRGLAERTLDDRTTRPHFLSAIVLDQIRTEIEDVPARLVIDGQQRLTSLQLLMGALRHLFAELSEDELTNRLDRLTRNDDAKETSAQHFKVWPTNVDRARFEAIIDSRSEQSPVDRIESARALATATFLATAARLWARPRAAATQAGR